VTSRGDSGLTRLEWLGIVATVFMFVLYIDPLRTPFAWIWNNYVLDSTLVLGIVVAVSAVAIFCGSVFLVLYTDLGKRLGFLIAGAALTGWLAINGLLFTLYVPRGPRPPNIEGLNAFQIRIMPLALMIVSAILCAMFISALVKLESAEED